MTVPLNRSARLSEILIEFNLTRLNPLLPNVPF